jgi:hypothetical protein
MATNNFLDQAGLGYLWTKILSAIESHSVTLPDKLVSYKAVTTITATEKLNADTFLTDQKTGEVIYPQTIIDAVHDSDGRGLREMLDETIPAATIHAIVNGTYS